MEGTFEELINSFKNIFKVSLNNIVFTDYKIFLNYLEDNIEFNKTYYYMKIKMENYQEIPSFRDKKKLIAYIHYKLDILDKLFI